MARGVTSNSFASSPIENSCRSSPPANTRALERVLILQPEDVDVGLIRTGDDAAAGRRLVVVDIRVVHLHEGVAQIELAAASHLVGGAERKPQAVVYRQKAAASRGIG